MLTIYNTISQAKEIFKPINEGKVGLYICGVTVYDYCHLGHARVYTSADIIVRYLQWRGYEVNHVRNITDIDDKIIKRAHENGEDCSAVTERFTKAMHDDFSQLCLLAPNHEPRATDYILPMVELIDDIIKNQHAYIAENGDVYFDVRSFPSYGCLSHHNIDDLESGARVEVSEAKKDPLDFVLWKLAKPGEPSWDSPWGLGRPGWHIECSAMSMQLLGEHFDIHVGGRDLIFPHHENEIAQSVAGTQSKFVNLWMHAGFLQIDKEKMSKSLGNFVTIRDVLRIYSPEILRYFLTASHYRSPLVYTDDALQQAKQSVARIYTALRFLPEAERMQNSHFEKGFVDAMDDDFNTPIALSVLFDLAHEIQRVREKDLPLAASLGASLKHLGGVLGLFQSDPEAFFKAGSEIDENRVESLLAIRERARAERNWAESDRIRQVLLDMGVVVEDGASGATWKRSL